MNNYDYLVVGAGLLGAVFAHEAAKKGKKSRLSKNETTLLVTSIQKKLKEFRSMNMELILSTLLRRKFGTM